MPPVQNAVLSGSRYGGTRSGRMTADAVAVYLYALAPRGGRVLGYLVGSFASEIAG